jgi:hypothetical protein
MGIKSLASKLYARRVVRQTKAWSQKPEQSQQKVFRQLIDKARYTDFGKDHGFGEIQSIKDFQQRVSIRDYESLKPYIEKVLEGKENVLWPGKPKYLSKTSGTTSGAKYIPLTKESIPTHIDAARDAILHYIHLSGNREFVNGKMIFLQGSPELDTSGAIPVGRLSGIVAHYVPAYLQKNRLPDFRTNSIADWETKVDAIVEKTIKEDMRLISGIPPWIQMYFERLLDKSGKTTIQEIFPNFSLFIYGGVNYKPYETALGRLIGKEIDAIELYPASEGFIAYQDNYRKEGMLLLLNSGIFYEFIPIENVEEENPPRLTIGEVELHKNYVIILSTNAGLWAYDIGDTVKFVSKDPYRIVVTGRVKHFTSAFGEHVIAEEVEKAITYISKKFGVDINEFHLAPEVKPPEDELPYHDWFIEFNRPPEDIKAIASALDLKMRELNTYYDDLISGKILQPLKIRSLPKGTFNKYMKAEGKLGGQNKTPRLANDRMVAEGLLALISHTQ